MTYLRSNRLVAFGVPLNGKVQHRILVLIPQQAEQNEGVHGVVRSHTFLRDVFEMNSNASPRLQIKYKCYPVVVKTDHLP